MLSDVMDIHFLAKLVNQKIAPYHELCKAEEKKGRG